MGSIIERKRADRTTGYTAKIMIEKAGKLIHSEAQTFDRRQAAAAWMEKRERVIRAPRVLDKARRPGGTFADAINKYVTTTLKDIGRTKAQVTPTTSRFTLPEPLSRRFDPRADVSQATRVLETITFRRELGN